MQKKMRKGKRTNTTGHWTKKKHTERGDDPFQPIACRQSGRPVLVCLLHTAVLLRSIQGWGGTHNTHTNTYSRAHLATTPHSPAHGLSARLLCLGTDIHLS